MEVRRSDDSQSWEGAVCSDFFDPGVILVRSDQEFEVGDARDKSHQGRVELEISVGPHDMWLARSVRLQWAIKPRCKGIWLAGSRIAPKLKEHMPRFHPSELASRKTGEKIE